MFLIGFFSNTVRCSINIATEQYLMKYGFDNWRHENARRQVWFRAE